MPPYSIGQELAGLLRQERAHGKIQQRVARLFEEARDDVYRYLLTLGLHPPEAQEGAQEVFLRLYATLRQGADIENDRAWVFRVAHNLGLKMRARDRLTMPFDADLEARWGASPDDPERDLIKRERLLRFHRAVENLSDQQRRCLHLRLEGLRYPEIAAALGISVSAVGEFLRRAVVRLRKVHEA